MDGNLIRIASSPWVLGHISDEQTLPDEDAIQSAKMGFFAVVDGATMKTRGGVFRECASKLSFPSYFGGNWNAFNDCIRDLEWIREKSIVLAIKSAADLLIDGDADEFGLFMRLVLEAAEELNRTDEFRPGRAVYVVLHSRTDRGSDLRFRLESLHRPVSTEDK